MALALRPKGRSPAQGTYPGTDFKPTEKQKEAFKLLANSVYRNILLVGGSRSTKTFTFCYAIMNRALMAPNSKHAILRMRANACDTTVGLDTLPKVNRLCFPKVRMVEHNRPMHFFELPNESKIFLGGLDDKERVEKILGNEYSTLFLNECSQISYSSALVAYTRLAEKVMNNTTKRLLPQRAYHDLNPPGKSHWTNQLWMLHQDPLSRRPITNKEVYAHMFMNPVDNRENLDQAYLDYLATLPERQRVRFYEGRFADEVEGALWSYEILEENRREKEEISLGDMRRMVVSVDPSGAKSPSELQNNEIGIIVGGVGLDNHGYIWADRSLRDSPAVWGNRVVQAYKEFKCDRVLGESNFGGEMVRFVIQTADRAVPVDVITASRGKIIRADPVSALYEKHLVHHIGRFPELEDQMCSMSTNGYTGEGSPDRADAAIHLINELMVNTGGPVNIKSEDDAYGHTEAEKDDAPWNM